MEKKIGILNISPDNRFKMETIPLKTVRSVPLDSPILDGNMDCTHKGKYVFSNKKKRFVTAHALSKCLEQIKWQRLLLTSAPMSELPSNISTMVSRFRIF